MTDRLELLSEDLIEQHMPLALEVLAASSRLGLPLGWHYVLDLVWLLRELDLPPGATVLDAGAGWGLAQFLCADRGYRVVSVDMSARVPRAEFAHLYNFETLGSGAAIEHAYLDHQRLSLAEAWRVALNTPLGALPGKIGRRLGLATPPKAPPVVANAPRVTLYRANLERLDALADASVDAVISVSALEHNPPAALPKVMRELTRVLRPNGQMLITTSACARGEVYHAPSHSHLQDEAGLTQSYALESPRSNFAEFAAIEAALRRPRYLDRWLAWTYDHRPVSGMPGRIWDPAYLPVAIARRRRAD